MLARFRNRTLGFRANEMWFYDQETADSTCILCTENVKEDEYHFIFQCKVYEDNRKKSKLFDLIPLKPYNLLDLLVTNDENIICFLAKYIAESYDIREKKPSAINS